MVLQNKVIFSTDHDMNTLEPRGQVLRLNQAKRSHGTLLGYFVVKLLFKHQKGKIGDKKDWIKLSVINIIIILVIVFVRYPLMKVVFSWTGY